MHTAPELKLTLTLFFKNANTEGMQRLFEKAKQELQEEHGFPDDLDMAETIASIVNMCGFEWLFQHAGIEAPKEDHVFNGFEVDALAAANEWQAP